MDWKEADLLLSPLVAHVDAKVPFNVIIPHAPFKHAASGNCNYPMHKSIVEKYQLSWKSFIPDSTLGKNQVSAWVAAFTGFRSTAVPHFVKGSIGIKFAAAIYEALGIRKMIPISSSCDTYLF